MLKKILFLVFCCYTSSVQTKNIWIHTGDADDIVSMHALVLKIQELFPDTQYTITTQSPETHDIASYLFPTATVKTIYNENLESTAHTINKINPALIILTRHQLSPFIILCAKLKNIPVFLINATYASTTARLLNTQATLYEPLLNSLTRIFVQTNTDKKSLTEARIVSSKIKTLGNLYAYNIYAKKQHVLDLLKTTENEIGEKINYPIIYMRSRNKHTIQNYIQAFCILKQKFKKLKIILDVGQNKTSWKQEFLNSNKKLKLFPEILDIKTQDPTTILDLFGSKSTCDIIFSHINHTLFFWLAPTTIYILDEDTYTQTENHVIQAATWQTPLIIGPKEKNLTHSHHKKKKQIPKNLVPRSKNFDNLCEIITKILSKKDFRKKTKEPLSEWTKKTITKVTNGFDKFFIRDLKKNLDKKKNN